MRKYLMMGAAPLLGGLLLASTAMVSGCNNKEKVVDIETPAGQVEVERDRDTGEIDVETTDNN